MKAVKQASQSKSILLHGRHPVHKSALTERNIKKRRVRMLLFPPCAADLNPIENLWGIVSSQVYSGDKVYQDRGSLASAVRQAWAVVQSDLYSSGNIW